VTDAGWFTLPEALHVPVRRHDLEFHSLAGALLLRVAEPDLTLIKWSPQPDGRLITVSRGPEDEGRTLVVYEPDGQVLWRRAWRGGDFPDATVTPDGRRLVLVIRDTETRSAELLVLGPGNELLASHSLPNLYALAPSPDSRLVAAAGQQVVVLVDATSGRLVWRRDEPVDRVLPGGLTFDPQTGDPLVVALYRDRRKDEARLSFRRFGRADGAVQQEEIDRLPLDAGPVVLEIVPVPSGGRRIVFQDRLLEVEAGGRRQP
jgi:hypothetical protein